jgi:hypothetical protein
MIYQIAPNNIFGNNPIKTVVINGIAVAANQTIVAAVANKRILVVGGVIYSNGAFTQVTFKSASGGTALRSYAIPANTVATPNVFIVPSILESFETNTGEGLFADNSAVIAICSIDYIEYTP